VAQALTPCAHCGLPGRARYCCFGCELAARIAAEARDDHSRLYGTFALTLVLSMIVMMLSLFLYAEDVFDAGADVEMAWLRAAYRWASWVLATPVMALGGWPLARRAWDNLRERRLSMDALILLGAAAAYALSVFNLFARRGGVYFDSATTAIVLATFGRYLEASARTRASQSLGPLLEVSRGVVHVLDDAGGKRQLSAAEIAPGMRIEVGAEQVVPVDLVLDDATADVSLAVLSGESRPVPLERGSQVPAGAVPFSRITGRALRASHDSALERLAELARGLAERPSGVMRWADRFAAALTPLVALVAIASAVYWARTHSLGQGIVIALAVVLAACPCSYAIASPLVQWLALRRAFSHKVLVRSAEALEALAQVRVVAFDKTGTLTRDHLHVLRETIEPGADRAEVHALVAALEDGLQHPVARALRSHVTRTARAEPSHPVAHARRDGVSPRPERAGTAIGRGAAVQPDLRARARRDGASLGPERAGEAVGRGVAGQPDPLAMTSAEAGPVLDSRRVVPGRGVTARDAQGRALFIGGSGGDIELSRDGAPLARFTLSEELRAEAREAIGALRALSVRPLVLSGDDEARVNHVARALDLDAAARLSPEDKLSRLAASGEHVAMVGDGINDAPALAGRLTGFTFGHAAQLAKGVAQVTLLEPDLRMVPWTLALARRAVRSIKWLLGASTVYNVIFVALAAGGALRPVWAGLSMLLSSLLALAFAAGIGGAQGQLDEPAPLPGEASC
jgi:Cu2+-exporting ATPase